MTITDQTSDGLRKRIPFKFSMSMCAGTQHQLRHPMKLSHAITVNDIPDATLKREADSAYPLMVWVRRHPKKWRKKGWALRGNQVVRVGQ